MKTFNIFISGVGGQGIGLLSETMLRAIDHSGQNAIGVDTHGLAQRGGIVASQIRIGDEAYSPIVSKKSADLVVSLERHEALRAAADYLKSAGTLIYYNTSWQPLPVRLKKAREISVEQVEDFCKQNSFKHHRVRVESLADPRMQNIALLAAICQNGLLEGVLQEHYVKAMQDLMAGSMLEQNLELFKKMCN